MATWVITADGKLLNLHYVRRIWRHRETGHVLADTSGLPYVRLAVNDLGQLADELIIRDNIVIGQRELLVHGSETDA